MDGVFAPTLSPAIESLWLPKQGIRKDIHVMFQHPFHQLKKLLDLNPDLIIIQAEANPGSVDDFIKHVKKTKVRLGIALLAETSPSQQRVSELIRLSDYVLIFCGHLGYHGGIADLALLDKVAEIKSINPNAEIGWDGGINKDNIRALADGGIDVLNVGAAIQKATNPENAYRELRELVA
jgi:pentose-5-phosphate-3-epimerase